MADHEKVMGVSMTRRQAVKAGAVAFLGMALASGGMVSLPVRRAFATTPEWIDSSDFQDKKYTWMMQFKGVQIENVGAKYPLSIHDSITTQDNNTYRNVLSHKYPDAGELDALAGNAVRFTGAEYSDGTLVDLLVTVQGYEKDFRSGYTYPQYPYNYFIAALSDDNLKGTNPQISTSTKYGAPLFEWAGFKYIDFGFKFVYAGTQTAFPVSGHFSLSDLDWGERVSFGQVDKVLILKGNKFVHVEYDEMVAELGERDSLADSTVTVLLDNVSSFSMRAYQNPWKSGLYCLDSTTNVNIVPDNPEKTVLIRGDE